MEGRELLGAMLSDPFRIGLIIALVLTMARTQSATGVWIPLAAGALFVAVIIPMTMGGVQGADLVPQVIWGLIANVIWLAIFMVLRHLWLRVKA